MLVRLPVRRRQIVASAGRPRGPIIRVSFDYRCPFRPERARVGNRRSAGRPRLGRRRSRRSHSTRCTSKRATPVWERDPAVWGTGVNALLWGIAACEPVPDQGPRLARCGIRGPATTRAARSRKARVLHEITRPPPGLDADAGRGGVATPAGRFRDSRPGAHRGGEAALDVRRPDASSSTTEPCSCGSWTAESRRHRPRARPARVVATSNEFKHTSVPADAVDGAAHRAHESCGSDHVGGREGPRAPSRLLQPHDAREHGPSDDDC